VRRLLLVLLLLLGAMSHGFAVQPDEILDDPALEARARQLSAELRCLVCQNQSIDDSNAELARDLRLLVRERIVAGDSDREIIDYIVARYGEFVLLRPRYSLQNLILWVAPALILLLAALIFILRRRNFAGADSARAPLSDEEKQRLARVLDEHH
jgi:cytochrome c-type biogenesis protein CcmH